MTSKDNKKVALRELAHAIDMSFEHCLKFQMSEDDFVEQYGKSSFIHLREVGLVMVINRRLHKVQFNKDDGVEEVIVEVESLMLSKASETKR